ncbi:MAG: TonB-dependent receptor [Rhodothermales bacterium]|nr:TonB-dependent receptor [Rhodothermales bacterium]MBO6780760.1 TonB-dependent receptor [Rhodothermales bacterium]
MKFFSLLAAMLLAAPLASAQSGSIRGFVTDADNGESLEFVNVVARADGELRRGSVTDLNGFFVLTSMASRSYELTATFIGYETFIDTVFVPTGQSITVNIALVPDQEVMDEILVESERSTGAARVTAGQQTVRPEDIDLIPAPDVSGDLATLLRTLPGVVSSGDRGGQLFVRGGEPSQNQALLDGILLYQPFHILGFYSAFPAEIINRADIYAGGFKAKFGERISSVMDVSTRNGNNRQFEGSASVSPFVSAAHLEGPIVPGKLTLLTSVRKSLVEQAAADLVGQPLPFDFGDAFAKLSAVFDSNQRASITALSTHDRGTLGQDLGSEVQPEEIRWENRGIGARYVILPRRFPVFFEANVSYSSLESSLGPADDPSRSTFIENGHAMIDLQFFRERTTWNGGASLRTVQLQSDMGGLFQNFERRSDRLLHFGLYLEPEYAVNQHLKVRPGLRAQFFDVRFQPFLEPRLRILYERGNHEFSLAGGYYEQAEIGLYDRRDAASVFMAWTNAIARSERFEEVSEGRVQTAIHGLLGYRTSLPAGIELSAEAYAKRLNNLFISEWTAYPRFTTNLQPATGRSYGFDLRAEIRRPRFYGYLTYGLSNTRYAAEQAQLRLWYGTESLEFRPPHDRRHQVNALASTTVKEFDVSVRWEFGSGLPFSRVVGFDGFALVNGVINPFEVDVSRRVIYERPFSGELPAYHRMDASVARSFEVERAEVTLQASVINAYDRANLFYLDVFTLRRADQLPFVPSLGIKVAFR